MNILSIGGSDPSSGAGIQSDIKAITSLNVNLDEEMDHQFFWGVNQATKDLKIPPDIIFHEGDFGKEPMILVFGKNPSDVIKKISKVF